MLHEGILHKRKLDYDKRKMRVVDHLNIQNVQALNNCRHYFPNVTKLTLTASFKDTRVSLPMLLKTIIPLKQLTTLAIDHHTICIEQFLKLLIASPNVHTLIFEYQPINEINAVLNEPTESFRLLSEKNKITTVILKAEFSNENIQFLVTLCPRMQHLTVDTHYRFDIDVLVRFLLSKTKNDLQHLCLLCVKRMASINPGTLKTLIETEELLDNYSIKVINNEVYLWW